MANTLLAIDLSNPVADHPLNKTLDSWWLADVNPLGMTWYDLVGYRTGTLTGFTVPYTSTSGWVAGSTSGTKALGFAGTNYVTCGTSDTLIGDFTLAVRFWMSSTPAIAGGLFAKRGSPATGYAHEFATTTGNTVSFLANNATLNWATSVSVSTNVWTTLILTRIGNDFVLYKNGFSAATLTNATAVPSTSAHPNLIGRGGLDAASYLTGKISEVSIRTYGISADQVLFLNDQMRRGNPDLLRQIQPAMPTLYKMPHRAPSQGAAVLNPAVDLTSHFWQGQRQFADASWYVPQSPPTRQRSQDIRPLPDPLAEFQVYTNKPFSQWYIPTSPPTRQSSQDVRPLLDFWQEWEAYRQAPDASWYVPDRAPTRQASQRFDPLPNFLAEWQRYRVTPFSEWYVPDRAPTRQSSQDVRPLADFLAEWQVYRVVPFSRWYVPDRTPTRQSSQDVRPLPEFNYQWWEAYRQVPYSQWYIPTPPPTKQPSQLSGLLNPPREFNYQWWEAQRQAPQAAWYFPPRPPTRQPSQVSAVVNPLPNFNYQWWEAYRQVPDASWYVPEEPLTRQPSQDVRPLPVFDFVWYGQKYDWAIPLSFVPDSPTTHQGSQDIRPLPEFGDVWYRQHAHWPTPIEYIPPQSPVMKQSSQDVRGLPDFTALWWEQFRLMPPPSGVFTSDAGLYGVSNTIVDSARAGSFRVANDIQGYNVYVGEDALPDLEASPNTFSPTLPISVPVTPPLVGTKTVYVIVRAQDVFGLESQNQNAYVFTVDTAGNLVLPSIAEPSGLALYERVGMMVRVLATYPGYTTDLYPASMWQVFAGTTPPNVSVDAPVTTVEASDILTVEVGPFVAGTVYFAVRLLRALDGAVSPAVTGSIELTAAPNAVTPVEGGFVG